MNSPLGIPAPIGALIVAPTCAKAARLAHKAKRGERGQPGKPFWRIRGNGQFFSFRTDQHIAASGSVLDQRNEWRSFLRRMTDKGRYLLLVWHVRHRACQGNQRLISDQTELSFERRPALLCTLLPLP